MPKIEEHLKWCLKDSRRLIKTKPDVTLAQQHLKKSEYNYGVVQTLEKLKVYDWALNVGFYAVYHCFLAILSKYGYETRNQSCTITVILKLIEEGKIDLDKDLISQFDTLEPEKNITTSTIRELREASTYGVETSVDLKKLETIKQLIVKVQRETIKILKK
ncbi:hypothetical protein HY837_00975 [archaeon]|nr:hypothetical protein [archaeon]